MKNKFKLAGVICLVAILGFAFCLSSSKSVKSVTSPDWYLKKLDITNKHDAHNQDLLKAQASNLKPQIDYAKLNQGNPQNTNIGVYSINEFPMQLPGISQSQYQFTNVGVTKYDILFAGVSISNTSRGIIIDMHIDPKTSQDSIRNFEIEKEGKIKINTINSDGINVDFNTETGKKGTFNTSDGTYKLN